MAVPTAARRWTLAADAVIAAAVGAFAVLIAQPAAAGQIPPRQPLDVLAYSLIGVAAVALVLRRLLPAQILTLTVSAMAVYFAAGYPYGPAVLTMSIAMFTVAELRSPRRSLLACLLATLSVVAAQLVNQPPPRLAIDLAAIVGGGVSWLLPGWALGVVVRAQRAAMDARRAEQGRRQTYEERLRIAQEVHDVVGHELAVIAMQAGVALHVLHRRPDQAREALQSIRKTSMSGLEDLRGALELLGGDAPRRPTPGMDQLEELVAATSGSGVPVDLVVTGERCDLPAVVEHAAYRIIQESLTNVLRHAVPATATVRVSYRPDELVIDVTDTGPCQDTAAPRGGGNGIAGMRARADAVGGEFTAGPRPVGGFRVAARLPLRNSPP